MKDGSRDLVLAVDPGGMTGWAAWDPAEGDVTSGESEFGDFVCMVESWLSSGWIGAVVAERYTITAQTLRKSRQHTALEVIGWLRGRCLMHDIPFVLQSPADAKRFSTDERLKATGWRKKGQGHANDAARHLMLHLVKAKLIEAPRVP